MYISPTFNGSSVLERFEHSNAIEIHNRIMFDFYTGLPYVVNPGMCLHAYYLHCTKMHENIQYTYIYLLISSNSCVLSLGVFMAMDSTAPWNNTYTCSGSNSYHIRCKYVFPDDLCICSLISVCICVLIAYTMMNST